ncbi:MAG: hypothetical protein CML40_00980 [Rhodobacteraceae bacterium]|nr:MAG: hypothetical protein CML40_00980 [Paracoccaceae bacterium]
MGFQCFSRSSGVGKTTIAQLISAQSDSAFIHRSAIDCGVADLRKIFSGARARKGSKRGTVLLIDEIHRFNRSQQDSFFPHIEDGSIRLIRATAEDSNF